jgi:hypothetical protein
MRSSRRSGGITRTRPALASLKDQIDTTIRGPRSFGPWRLGAQDRVNAGRTVRNVNQRDR